MKTKFFIIISLFIATFSANAKLHIEEYNNNTYVMLPNEYNTDEDVDCMCVLNSKFDDMMLYLEKKSDVQICTENGVTVFKGENVKVLDCKNWQSGSYTVFVNGNVKLKFAI